MDTSINMKRQGNSFLPIITYYNGWIIFLIISGLYIVLTFIANNYIFTDQIYYRSFSDQIAHQSIDAFLNMRDQLWWLNLLLQPLIILFKVSFTTICISIGAALSTIEFKFKTIFKAALLAEVIFIIGQTLFVVNISFHLDTFTLETISNYYPFTILGFLGAENIVPWLEYPLRALNLFEIFYVLAITWLLYKQWKENFIESLVIVMPSYIIGLILWLGLVTFLTLQVS